MKIAIIGAGVAGMTTAYCLTKKNQKVDVYEASSKIGGLAASFDLWNQKVDIGPHRFFSSDKRVNELWLEVVGNDYLIVNRLTRIYYKNKFFKYPLRIANTIHGLGLTEAMRCAVSYFYAKARFNETDKSFESWVKQKFGKRLFSIFFKAYTEKLWGIDCKDLDSDFAAQRIKGLSLFEAIKSAMLDGRRNKHKTLIDQFAYPTGGSGMVYERMARYIESAGNNVYLNTPVFRIVNRGDTVTGLELGDGTFVEYDYVVSTMPYTLMVKGLSNIPTTIRCMVEQLRFRNTVIVYLLIDSIELFPDNWIYVHSPDLKMGRITNFRNWAPQLYNDEKKSILAIEYWCDEGSDMWELSDEKFIALASSEIHSTKLVEPERIEDGFVYRVSKSYPVYHKGYKDVVRSIDGYLSSIQNLCAIGRYGAFKYNNQDHSILMGLLAAENITEKTKHKLCNVNSDYETFQESFIITDTGLQKQI